MLRNDLKSRLQHLPYWCLRGSGRVDPCSGNRLKIAYLHGPTPLKHQQAKPHPILTAICHACVCCHCHPNNPKP